MNEADLLSTYPRLWHMAEDGSWPSISKHGLLSTSAALDLCGVHGAERFSIESQRRPHSVVLSPTGSPSMVIRDQKPMSDGALEKCLEDDLTPEQWYRILNQKTFFWLSRPRLRRLLGARAYRNLAHTILTVDTATLVAVHRDQILLSPINSGSTIMKPQPRGLGTFLPIDQYPFHEWRKKRSLAEAVVELAVVESVPDILDHVLAVHRVEHGQATELWRSKRALADDGP